MIFRNLKTKGEISPRAHLSKSPPMKCLTVGLSQTGGRNHHGRITVRHHGGGHKRTYRIVDFARKKIDVTARVVQLEYDPNRSAFIALIQYDDGEYSYIIAPEELKIGDLVISSSTAEIKIGNCLPLVKIPIGSTVHNVELKPGKGGQLARSAGTSAQVVGKYSNHVVLRFQSGLTRLFPENCCATIGTVSNSERKNVKLYKAGQNRWLGNRPTVRGTAMNSHDHPNGGGRGKSKGGHPSMTPWGLATKGRKTRKKNLASNKYILRSSSRRKK